MQISLCIKKDKDFKPYPGGVATTGGEKKNVTSLNLYLFSFTFSSSHICVLCQDLSKLFQTSCFIFPQLTEMWNCRQFKKDEWLQWHSWPAFTRNNLKDFQNVLALMVKTIKTNTQSNLIRWSTWTGQNIVNMITSLFVRLETPNKLRNKGSLQKKQKNPVI